MTDIRQSKDYANYIAKTNWKVEKIGKTHCYIKNIPILGAVIKVQRPEKLNINKVESLSKRYRTFQIIVEPKDDSQMDILQSRGYKLSSSPYLPTKTLLLDLTLSKQKLFNNLKKDAKYSLRKTKNLSFSPIRDSNSFHRSWVKSTSFKRFVLSANKIKMLKDSFNSNSLFLASHNVRTNKKQSEAGAIFLIADKTVYYWQAFTSKKGRSTLSQYRLVWEGILWGKRKGAKIFDFEGIYDERFPNKSWVGFTHFKKSFGGYEFKFPGTFVKTRLPI